MLFLKNILVFMLFVDHLNIYFVPIRQDLQTARDKLQRMLIEMLRITMATEEHISHKLGACVSGGRSGDKTPISMTARSSRDSHEMGMFLWVC